MHSTRGPDAKNAEQSLTDSNISIAEVLSFVKDYFPDVLSDDVLSHYGMQKVEILIMKISALLSPPTPKKECPKPKSKMQIPLSMA